MPSLKVTVLIEVDGVPLKGFPLVRRLAVDQVQEFEYTQGAGTTNVAVPDDKINPVKALVIRPDGAVGVHLNSDAEFTLNANGLLVLIDGQLNAGAGAANNKLDNDGASAVTIRGLGAG